MYTSIEHAVDSLKPMTIYTTSPNLLRPTSMYMTSEEKDNKLTYAYEVAGIKIKCEEIFENKTKDMYLRFYGEASILNMNRAFDEKIYINTEVYDKYDWYVNNGILYIVLFEKINERPDFKRVEKVKKVTKEEVNE